MCTYPHLICVTTMDIPNGGDGFSVGNGGGAAGMWLGLVSSCRGHSAAVYSTLESVVTCRIC